ncbi:arsenate reductase ArsC [bacterium]|nr:arsenate reductase ArsC [bacterium]
MCTHNSARSQMAEGWLRKLAREAGLEADIWSAGTEKTLVKPPAIQVMEEIGVDLKTHSSKTLDDIPYPDNFDAVLTVCDSANDACPYFPAQTRRYHVSLPDPSGHDLERWRQSRDQIGRVMNVFVNHLWVGLWPTPEALEQARERARPSIW